MKNVETSNLKLLAGYVSALVGLTLGTLAACCTQALQGSIPDFQLSVGRSLLQTFAYITCGKIIGAEFNINKETIRGVLAIGMSYMVYNVGMYGATAYLPLSEVMGLKTIASLVFTLLFSKIIFQIDIKKRNVVSALVCIVGITLVAQPHWLFKQQRVKSGSASILSVNASREYLMTELNTSDVFVGYSLAIMGGAGTGLLYSVVGNVDLRPIIKASYGASLCLIGSIALMFYMEEPVVVMDLNQFMLTFGHAGLSVLAAFLFFQAGHYLVGPAISLVYSFAVIAMLIYQYTFMHYIKPGNYNWIEVFGCLIIIAGASIQPVVDILMTRAEANKLP